MVTDELLFTAVRASPMFAMGMHECTEVCISSWFVGLNVERQIDGLQNVDPFSRILLAVSSVRSSKICRETMTASKRFKASKLRSAMAIGQGEK